MCAAPRSGKTVVINWLLLHPNAFKDKFPGGVYIFSGSMRNGDASARFLLEEFGETVFSDYSDDLLRSIVSHHQSIPKDEREPWALIIDDYIGWKLPHSSFLFKFASEFRHSGCAFLLYSGQLYKSVPPLVRMCAHYAIFFGTANGKEITKMWEELGSRFGTEEHFKSLLDKATAEPHGFLYLDLYSRPATAYKCFKEVIWRGPSTNGEASQPISAAGFEG